MLGTPFSPQKSICNLEEYMEAKDIIIRCENINKKFKSKTVLEDVSFAVNRGEFLSLLGPSGCGKTTILRMLIGVEKPTSGRIIKDGIDITTEELYKMVEEKNQLPKTSAITIGDFIEVFQKVSKILSKNTSK